jgi:transglutaminase-like putative cysteine protease
LGISQGWGLDVGLAASGSHPVPYFLGSIPGGDAGVAATLQLMVSMVTEYRASPSVRMLAQSLVASCPSRDAVCQVRTVHAWVRDNIKYLPDVRNVETLQTPDYTLSMMSGDCDDSATLMASLIETLGRQSRFLAQALRGGDFSHVSAQVLLGTRWVNLETILPTIPEAWGGLPAGTPTPIGWFPSDVTRVMPARVP